MRIGFLALFCLLTSQLLAEGVKAENLFSAEQIAAIEKLIIKTLKENPTLVADALRTFMHQEEEKEKKQEAIAFAKMQKKLNEKTTLSKLIDSRTAICEGDQKAKRKLIIFYDNNCLHCRTLELKLQALHDKHPQSVTILHRPYPLVPESNEISAAVIAVARSQPTNFTEINTMIAKSSDFVSRDDIKAFAESMGLNWDQVLIDAASPEVYDIVKKNQKLGEEIGLDATPVVVFYDEEKGSCKIIKHFGDSLEQIFEGA